MWLMLGCLQETTKPDASIEGEDTSESEENQTHDSDTAGPNDTADSEDTASQPEAEYSCEAGFAYLESCAGISLSDSLDCTETLYAELELIQYLDCDTFLNAKDELPLCESLGLNCPESYYGCADAPLDATEVLSALIWTDTSTLNSIDQVAERNTNLRHLFAEHGDIRGAFASVYSPITDAAVESIEAGEFTHDQWVRELVIEFASRYYQNLRASILSGSTTQSWNRYYELSDDCNVAGLRVAVFGIAVHLIVDLPHTLATISSSEDHKEDYDKFGLKLIEANPLIIQNLQEDYGIEAERFFNGFFLGDWIDAIAGDDATTTFAFQTIRNKAWTNAMWLQSWQAPLAETEIYASWRSADGILATWDIVQ